MKAHSLVTLFILLIKGSILSPTSAVHPVVGSSLKIRRGRLFQHQRRSTRTNHRHHHHHHHQQQQQQHHPNSTTTLAHEDEKDPSPPLIQVQEILPTKLINEIDPELNPPPPPPPSSQDEKNSMSKSSSRRWIWWGNDMTKLCNEDDSSATAKGTKQNEEEHPLRTDLWRLQVQWFRRAGGKMSLLQKSHNSKTYLHMEFHKNGRCRLLSHDQQQVLGVGEWNEKPYAVWFCVRVLLLGKEEEEKDDDNHKYTFTAQLHHNPFGKHPKMQQGTILFQKIAPKQHEYDVVEYDEERDRLFVQPRGQPWFRPIVGKFTGVGIGVDTLDYSYSKRI
ncbi:unnamed protein product [Cylindrotheca closterium]|uniref:Uncharacterized protein n=1 Tax=Cylindrotheca closterium TaxID=2856 RepID=A0AAD2FIS8_9STRA|nr:unnamed protein product [Cylindrotheca closterium]